MTERVESLILEYLRAMRADIATIKRHIRDLKWRVASLETHVVRLFGDVLRRNSRFDEIGDRLDRIEKRLELRP